MVRLLDEQAGDLAARVGAPVELVGVAVRRLDAPREVEVPDGLLTTDADGAGPRDDVDVVVEVIGGIEPARSLILAALENGAVVVTANKALLAEDGPTLFEAAEKAGRDLYFEAAVAGAIPILRPLRESLAGDRVTRVLGIVNGTTNFILDKMDTTGRRLRRGARGGPGARLRRGRPDRRRRGLRRRREGRDPRLARLPLPGHRRRRAPRGHHRGDRRRRRVGPGDGQRGQAAGDLRAATSPTTASAVAVRVHPAMIPRSPPAGRVREAYNAVFVESEAAGQLMFYGPGAGGVADRVARCSATWSPSPATGSPAPAAPASRRTPTGRCCRWARPVTRYHVAIDVDDRAGVLAQVATAFAEHGVSIQTVRQEGRGDDAQLVVVSHQATDAQLAATVERLRGMDIVREVTSVMRVEGARNDRT